jgi:hypothetical protein
VFTVAGTGPVDFDTLCDKVVASLTEALAAHPHCPVHLLDDVRRRVGLAARQ